MTDANLTAAVYRRRDSVVLRHVAGEDLLIPIRHEIAQMHSIFALVGVGRAVWELLDGTRTLAEVRDALVQRYDVRPETAWTDLCAFLARLEEKGLVDRG